MPLTPEQIERMDAITGLPPTSPNQKSIDSRISELRTKAATAEKKNQTKPDNPIQGLANDAYKTLIAKPAVRLSQAIGTGIGEAVGGEYGEQVKNRAMKDMVVPSPFGKPVLVEGQKAIGEGGARQIASDAAKSASYIAPVGGAGTVASKVVGGKVLGAAASGAATGGISGAFGGLGEGLADPNKDAGQVATDTAIGAGIGAAAGGVLGGAAGLGGKVFNNINPTDAVKVERATDAINPNLTGKKKIDAYKEIVTGRRNVAKPGVFREQELLPDEKVKGLGERLYDVVKHDNPIDNLKSLGKELIKTEDELDTVLTGQPDVVYTADKQGLVSKLDEVKTTIPREFAAIRENKNVFEDVTEYAKELVAEGDDTIKGIRELRKAFDAQAQLEYPGAFKDGGVDVKTPAGRAIKAVRDLINDHLYETAPEGSEIQRLIGREADIFRATDYIAPKAAKTDGINLTKQVLSEFFKHPAVITAEAAIALGATLGAAKAFAGGGEGGSK